MYICIFKLEKILNLFSISVTLEMMFDDTNTSYYDILTKLHDRKLHFIGGCLSLSTQMIYFL